MDPCGSTHFEETTVTTTLNAEGLDLLFRKARTHNAWLP